MKVKLNSRQVNGVEIVDIAGVITLGEESNALRNSLTSLIDGNRKKLLLNLAGLTFIDSSGIRELVAAFNTLSKNGGQLKLLSPTRRVRDLLQITNLHSVFEIHDDEAAAISSFK